MLSRPADGTGGGSRLPGSDRRRYSRAMAFRLGRSGKRAADAPLFDEDHVIWGVPRRAGLDEQDDPKAHAGLTQHAFEPGNDDRAICGFEPPKRATGPTTKPHAQLAVPNSRLNPRCPKCLKLIAVPVAAIQPAAPDEPGPAEAVALAAEADATVETRSAEQEAPTPEQQAPTPEQLAAERIGATEVSEGEQGPDLTAEAIHAAVQPDDGPDPSIMAIVTAEPEPEQPVEPEPPATVAPEPEPVVEVAQPPQPPGLPPPPPPVFSAEPATPVAPSPQPAPPPRPAVDPPMSMRSASWEGTVVYYAGQQTALVRPPSQLGMGVVASVISGPSGTRVGSVEINAEGLAVISLSEPARGPVSVAWFAVPAVDENLRPGRQ